jgi:phage/plasmid-associated DNA primase
MWRRLRPIPLTNIPENPDKDLRPYLSDPEGGLPAVLSWAVDGAIKYLNSSAKDALGWCTVVRNAADVYKKNEDRIGLFFEEETQQGKDMTVTIASLFGLYRKWSDTRGERAMTQIAFQRKLSDRAMKIVGQGSKALLHGYAILPKAVPNWSDSVAASQIML